MRLMVIKNTHARLWRRLISRLLGRRADPVSVIARDLLPTVCFGALGERDHLALEGFTAARRPPAQGAPHEPPGHASPGH
jgi:hypothetical protein